MNIIKVDNISDKNISEFLSLKDKSLALSNTIIVETEKVVLKLLNSNTEVIKLFVNPDFIDRHSELLSKLSIDIYTADKEVMQEIIGHNLHHGVMALARRPEYISLDELQDKVLILNGLTSPENIGTIVRNCAAFNINSIIIDKRTCSPYVRRCIRVSMGNIFRVKVYKSNDLKSDLKKLQSLGHRVISTANQEGAIDLPKYSFPKKSCVIIGSEGHGIEKDILEVSDDIIRIPIDDTVAHLNAACSSSIFLYQLSQ
ncbi:putative SpoU-like rRNA methylase [Halobacteriovorax marinus SJ]|uniref:SpoU-like rRNA methylase n=1 Tax=Halobacteriovorax marinus (strain ATCC BAA-682 / DSM 15412 / SJ) TaxID=862908 RepID=E1X1P1_HALMS|nr:RNA methyltransferase [Halobacteriovorax marinus]CBW24960.1 putative SpoU-like rRNA methylase [Halobacteriovorax marinus SJ]